MTAVSADQRNETVRLNYLQWKDEFRFEKPYTILSAVPEGVPKQNFSLGPGPRDEVITDIRGHEAEFSLDENGFEIRQQKLTVASLEKKETVEQEYFAEMTALLQTVSPGAEVHIFDWRVMVSVMFGACPPPTGELSFFLFSSISISLPCFIHKTPANHIPLMPDPL